MRRKDNTFEHLGKLVDKALEDLFVGSIGKKYRKQLFESIIPIIEEAIEKAYKEEIVFRVDLSNKLGALNHLICIPSKRPVNPFRV